MRLVLFLSIPLLMLLVPAVPIEAPAVPTPGYMLVSNSMSLEGGECTENFHILYGLLAVDKGFSWYTDVDEDCVLRVYKHPDTATTVLLSGEVGVYAWESHISVGGSSRVDATEVLEYSPIMCPWPQIWGAIETPDTFGLQGYDVTIGYGGCGHVMHWDWFTPSTESVELGGIGAGTVVCTSRSFICTIATATPPVAPPATGGTLIATVEPGDPDVSVLIHTP